MTGSNKILILIMGKTGSGKDTLASYLEKEQKIPRVVSYTTAKKRDDQEQGREHFFITEERMAELIESEPLIGYAKSNTSEGVQYCALYNQLKYPVMSYVINPKAIATRNDMFFGPNNLFSNSYAVPIYVYAPDEICMSNAISRGGYKTDVQERLKKENDEFDKYIPQIRSHIEVVLNTSTLKNFQENIRRLVDHYLAPFYL